MQAIIFPADEAAAEAFFLEAFVVGELGKVLRVEARHRQRVPVKVRIGHEEDLLRAVGVVGVVEDANGRGIAVLEEF